jgi:hypothetical protein
MYYYPTHYYPYYYYPMYKYASLYDKVAPALPYLGAAGVGAGLGALGGAGIGAWRGGGDWKKALKSALIGMVAGAVVGPAAYAGYQALFPTSTPAPAPTPVLGPPLKVISIDEAHRLGETHPGVHQELVSMGFPRDPNVLQNIFRRYGINVYIEGASRP